MGKKRKRLRDSRKGSDVQEKRSKAGEGRPKEEKGTAKPSIWRYDPIEHFLLSFRWIDTLIVLLLYAEALAMFFGASYHRGRGPTALFDNAFRFSYKALAFLLLAYGGVVLARLEYSFRAAVGWLLAFTGIVALSGVSLIFVGPLPKESFYRIYITSKVVVLYPAAWALLALAILKMIVSPKVRERVLKSPWFYIMIAYGAWELIHVFFGIMPAVSFFGSMPRQMGVITILSILFSSLAAYVWIAEDPEPRMKWVGRFLVLVAIGLAWRAAFEMSQSSTRFYRPSGFAGNPDFFGDHFVLLVPVTFLLYFSERDRLWQALALVGFLGQMVGSVFIQTRGAWLGMGVAGLVVLFTFDPKLSRKELMERLGILLVGAVVAIALGHLYIHKVIPMKGAYKYAMKNFLKNEWALYIMASLSAGPYVLRILWLLVRDNKRHLWGLVGGVLAFLLIIGAVPYSRKVIVAQVKSALRIKNIKAGREARPFVWRDTLQLIKEKWLTGVGRENYRVAFVRHKSRRLAIIDPTVNYRSSHNMYLDMLAMEGIVGLLLYLAMLGVGIFLGVKRRKNPYHLAMGVYVAGYAAHVLVIYDVVSTAYTIFMAIGLAGAGAWKEPIPVEERSHRYRFMPVTLVALLFVVGIVPASVHAWGQAVGDLNLARTKITSMILRRRLRELRKGQDLEDIRAMAKKIWNAAMVTGQYCSPLGYNCYLASHALMSLTYLNQQELGGISKDTVKRMALRFAKKGVRNNTNPESAYSRLGSAFYTMGDPANALRGFNTSIYYDHYFYDTHRMRALIYMQDYCEFEKAQKELNFAMDVLKFSGKDKRGPGRAVKSALSRLSLLRAKAQACLERKKQRGLGDPPSENETFVGVPIWEE